MFEHWQLELTSNVGVGGGSDERTWREGAEGLGPVWWALIQCLKAIRSDGVGHEGSTKGGPWHTQG